MCDILVTCRDKDTIYSGFEFKCQYTSAATATSKTLHNVSGEYVQMRLCKRHATMYEKKYQKDWVVVRD